MTEIEMEVDSAPQFGVDAHLDDDLIDYESEADKEPGHYLEGTKFIDGQPPQKDQTVKSDQDDNLGVELFTTDDKDEPAAGNVVGDNLEELHEADGSSHEIDYDVEDASKTHAEGDALEAATSGPQQDMQPYTTEETERNEQSKSLTGDHEISWDHENDENLGPHVGEGHLAVAGLTFSPAPEPLDEQHVDERYETRSNVTDDFGLDHSENVNESPDGSGDDTEAVDAEVIQQVESDDDSQHFPAITVHYKGDEYPCFATNSDGFFSRLSILDESVKSLLDGFREELVNELLAEDELVFQVDELGLEFSESSSQDLLANTTLRQVIDLFDILVKNQDPDNTRTLYTYLFTRPSTSKRFDFLMESATEGKGLDEVIHLFQSPMIGTAAHGDSSAAEDVETQFDEPESVDEDENSERYHVIDSFASNESNNEADTSDHVLPDQSQHALDNHVEDLHDAQHIEEELMVSGALADEDDVGDGEEEAAEGIEDKSFADTNLPVPAGDSNGASVVSDHPQIAVNATSINDDEGSEAADVLGFAFDETVAIAPVDVVDEAEAEVDQEHAQDDDDAAVGAADASTRTMTPRDNEESALVEFDIMDHGAEDYISEEAAGEEAADEIDWRDDPETVVGDVGGDASSTHAKRARGDDESSAEDDQSAKRRRP